MNEMKTAEGIVEMAAAFPEVMSKERFYLDEAGKILPVPLSVALTPMAMLGQAVANGAPLLMIEKLMDLQDRHQRNEAVRAFNNAMADAKRDLPLIQKNRKVDFTNKAGERTFYEYEDLAGILAVVDPILGNHGLSVRFRTKNEPNAPIVVTCVISHRDGYSEENTLSGPKDDSGKKNQLQQMGSTITYLQRYSLKAALGLASARDDDALSVDDSDDGEIGAAVQEFQDRLRTAQVLGHVRQIKLDINAHSLVNQIKERLRPDVEAASKRLDPNRVPTPEEMAAAAQAKP